jgi:peptidoglycan/LPS O-acetylase OafA/YrhL
MNNSPAAKTESSTHITAFDTVRGLAALSHRWVEVPSQAFGKSLPKRFEAWKARRGQPA